MPDKIVHRRKRIPVRWPIRLLAQHRIEPGLSRRAKAPLSFTGQSRVDSDEAYIVIIDDVVQEITI